MFVCVCHRVRDCELRAAVRRGARTVESVGDACGAGTGCGGCLERIDELVEQETGADTLASIAA